MTEEQMWRQMAVNDYKKSIGEPVRRRWAFTLPKECEKQKRK